MAYGKLALSDEQIQKLLWDPKREFFFPMSQREEKDKEGNVKLMLPKVELGVYGSVINVCACYDALTSARAYRAALGGDEAITLIEPGSGTHFDPAGAAAAVRLYERGEFNVDAMPSEMRPAPRARVTE